MRAKKQISSMRFRRTDSHVTFTRPFFEKGYWYVRRREPGQDGGRKVTRVRLKAAPNATRNELDMEITALVNAQVAAETEAKAEGAPTTERQNVLVGDALAEYARVKISKKFRPRYYKAMALMRIDPSPLTKTGPSVRRMWR